MIGWIVLGLLVSGGLILFASTSSSGAGAEERMSDAFIGLFGGILVFAGVLILLGAGLWQLF